MTPPASAQALGYPAVDGRYLIEAGPSARGWHRAATALRCPQLFAYTQRMPELIWPEAGVLVRGGLLHVGLAHYYARLLCVQQGWDPNCLWDPITAMRMFAHRMDSRPLMERRPAGYDGPARHPMGIPYAEHLDSCCRAVEAYARNWGSIEQWKIIAVEQPLAALIPESGWSLDSAVREFLFTQRPDLVVQDPEGWFLIIDHKCLPGRALVDTPLGPTSVEELRRYDFWTCEAWNGHGVEWARASKVAPAGMQAIWQLRTRTGRTLPLGYCHPVLTERGWVQAEQVRAGDYVAVPMYRPDRPDTDVRDSELLVLGALICDGALKRKSLEMTKNHEGVRAMYKAALADLGMSEDALSQAAAVRERVQGERAACVKVSEASPLHGILERLGVARVHSPDRELPRICERLSRRQAGVLLSALWDGDGSAYLGTEQGGKRPIRLVYASRSRKLCEGIQRLLTQLGVISSLTDSSVEYKGSRRPYYYLTVIGDEAKRRFLTLVQDRVIFGPRTAEKVPELLAELDRHRPPVSRHKNPKIEEGVFWDKVTSNLYVGDEECFDIEVPGLHTFLVDGVVTHNTRGRRDPRTTRGYERSGQFHGYYLFGRHAWAERFGGAFINYVTFGTKKASGKQDFSFERRLSPPKPWAQACFPDSIRHAERVVQDLELRGVDPWKWPKAFVDNGVCETRFGPCPCAQFCDYGPGGDPDAGKDKWGLDEVMP